MCINDISTGQRIVWVVHDVLHSLLRIALPSVDMSEDRYSCAATYRSIANEQVRSKLTTGPHVKQCVVVIDL